MLQCTNSPSNVPWPNSTSTEVTPTAQRLFALHADKHQGHKRVPQHTFHHITQPPPEAHMDMAPRSQNLTKGCRSAPPVTQRHSTPDTQTITAPPTVPTSHRAFPWHTWSPQTQPTEHRFFQKQASSQGPKTHSRGHRHALPPTNMPHDTTFLPHSRDSVRGT